MCGTPVYTQCQLQNHAGKGQFITFDDQKHWHGYGEPPKAIRDQHPGDFTHDADAAGSIAGVAYLLTDKLKWVIAWSNSEGQSNKVYTEILDSKTAVKWDDIKAKLEKSSSQWSAKNKLGYSSEVKIDETGSAPTMQATLRPAA